MKFFFNLLYFLVIIISIVIGVVKVYKIIIKVIINIEIDVNENNILNVNKSNSLVITVISVSNNNIK